MIHVQSFSSFLNESTMEISGHAYNMWNDKKVQRELQGAKIKIVGDMKGVLTISGEESELEKVRKIFGIKESTNEGSDENVQNYMFFGNLRTIKRHAEMLLALNPQQVDEILKDGHDWAEDHITTSKDDIEEVCNFLQNEMKERGTGMVPSNESKNLDEAMVQIAGKEKPAGAKVLATVIADYLEENKMLDSNFTSAAHGGKNKKFLVNALATFIMDNTF